MTEREAPQNRAADTFFRAGVVAVLYNPKTTRVLAGKRTKPPSGTWQFPQGGIEDGQDPFQTALTEVYEETGIELSASSLLKTSLDWISYELPEPTKFHGRGQTQKWFVFAYEGPAELQNPSDNEFTELAWMTPAKVIASTAAFRKAAYHQFFEEFEINFW